MERNTPGGYYKPMKKTLLALALVTYIARMLKKRCRILPAVGPGCLPD
jgi:hypothetical protein